MKVEIKHPAWVTGRLRGARKPSDVLVSVRTWVDLRVASDSDVAEAGVFAPVEAPGWHFDQPPAPRRLIDHDGVRYVRIEYAEPGKGSEAIGLDALRSWLAGATCGRELDSAMRSFFGASPVSALVNGLRATGYGGSDRGGDLPDDVLGEIEADGRSEAAAAVGRHMDRNFVVVGDEAYARFVPLIRCYPVGRAHALSVGLDSHLVTDGGLPNSRVFFGADRVGECLRLSGAKTATALSDPVREALATVPAGGLGDDDIRLMVPRLTVVATNWLEDRERSEARRGAADDVTRDILARMLPLAKLARVGQLGDETLPEATRLLGEAMQAKLYATNAGGKRGDLLLRRALYVDGYALPRIVSGLGFRPDDVAALDTLAP
jgi:hypothetical protein